MAGVRAGLFLNTAEDDPAGFFLTAAFGATNLYVGRAATATARERGAVVRGCTAERVRTLRLEPRFAI